MDSRFSGPAAGPESDFAAVGWPACEDMIMVRRPRQGFNVRLAIGPMLVVVLAAGNWLCGGRPSALGQPPQGGPTDSAYFEELQQQADEQQQTAGEPYQK